MRTGAEIERRFALLERAFDIMNRPSGRVPLDRRFYSRLSRFYGAWLALRWVVGEGTWTHELGVAEAERVRADAEKRAGLAGSGGLS